MMDVLETLRRTGAYREGHFLLTSGRHSDRFFLGSQLTQWPEEATRVGRWLAEAYRDAGVEVVVGPAAGGVLIAHETARALGCRSMYAEKDGDAMALKRGFSLRPGERVLLVEDFVTTGGSVRKCAEALRPYAPEFLGASVIVDRSGGQADLGVPYSALLTLNVIDWAPEDCPLCRREMPLTRPKAATGRV